MNIKKNEPHDIDIADKRPLEDSCSFVLIHGWQQKNITRGTHNYNTHFNFSQKFGIDCKSYPTSISTIMPLMGLCSCKEYVRVVHALAPNTHATPFDETMGVLHLFHAFFKVDFPPFH
jgi:hypothetical protein